MTTISCNVHTDSETRIKCSHLYSQHVNTAMITIDDITIFADNAELRRLADAINEYIAFSDAEAEPVAPQAATYKGWQISFNPKPIPVRDMDWTATSPDYDTDCDQDGFFVCSGFQVSAATLDGLKAEIDFAIEEMVP